MSNMISVITYLLILYAVHPIYLCYFWRWSVRRTRMACRCFEEGRSLLIHPINGEMLSACGGMHETELRQKKKSEDRRAHNYFLILVLRQRKRFPRRCTIKQVKMKMSNLNDRPTRYSILASRLPLCFSVRKV